MFIPDLNFSIPDPGSRIKKFPDSGSSSTSKSLSTFIPTNWYPTVLSCRKYDPEWNVHPVPDPGSRSGSRIQIRIPDPDLDFLPIPDPRSRGQKGTGSNPRFGSATLLFTFFLLAG
jgi:hypothetical protein